MTKYLVMNYQDLGSPRDLTVLNVSLENYSQHRKENLGEAEPICRFGIYSSYEQRLH